MAPYIIVFRLDVISFISKAEGLPDGNEVIGSLMGVKGVEHYFYGPRLHEFLHELNVNTFGKYDAFTVGECQGTGIEMSKLMTGDYMVPAIVPRFPNKT